MEILRGAVTFESSNIRHVWDRIWKDLHLVLPNLVSKRFSRGWFKSYNSQHVQKNRNKWENPFTLADDSVRVLMCACVDVRLCQCVRGWRGVGGCAEVNLRSEFENQKIRKIEKEA